MSIAKIQDNGGRATSGTLTVTLGSAPTLNNLLVAFWGWNGSNSTFPVPSGWSLAKQWPGTAGLAAIWYRVAGVSEPSSLGITPASGNQYDLHLAEFSGLANPALDKTAKADSGASTVTTLTSESTGALVGIGDLLLSCMVANTTLSAPSWTSPMTALRATSRMLSAWAVDTDQTAKTPQVSWTGAGKVALAAAAISPLTLSTGFEGWGIPV